MQAIETEYKGPTNTRGSRIIAKAECGRLTVPWDYALSVDENHCAAVKAFVLKWGWWGAWSVGHLSNGKGLVAVCSKRYGFTSERKTPRVTVRVTP